MAEPDAQTGLLKQDYTGIKILIREHPAIIITFLYLLCSSLGLIYMYYLLDQFDILVLSHIELMDFLLAILSNPAPLFFLVGVVVLSVLSELLQLKLLNKLTFVGRIKKWFQSSSENLSEKSSLYRYYYQFEQKATQFLSSPVGYSQLFFIIIWLYSQAEAVDYAEKVKQGSAASYSVTTMYPIDEKNKSTLHLGELQLIISTNRYLWLYKVSTSEVIMVPHDNIASILPLVNSVSEVERQANDDGPVTQPE